jgi:hypothetical protein
MRPMSLYVYRAGLCAGALALFPGPLLAVKPAPKAAGPAPDAVLDVAAYRDKLVLLTDGKGHYVAVLPGPVKRSVETDHGLFYGDGKRFYSVPVQTGSMNGEQWAFGFREPRLDVGGHAEGTGDLRFEPPDKYTVYCGARKTALKAVEAAEAAKVLGAATFERSPRQWRPYALARDSKGRYYYVDRGATKEREKSFRLFAGPKGDLKLQKMTNVVSDSEGDVFSTKTGSLRMVLGKGEASWIEKESPQKLVIVPVDFNKNVAMIYTELGVYSGERLGTPCDDL